MLTNGSINQTYFNGQMAALECVSMGGPNNTYLWQANGKELIGEVLHILMINITHESGGEYTCFVSNLAGRHSASTFLFVYPYFLSHPGDVQVSLGSMILLTCDAVGFPSPEYLWQRADGRGIRGGVVNNRRTLRISNVEFGDEGEYFCNASGSGVTVQSSNGTITCTFKKWVL
jgi:hypothetical protein